MDLRRTVLRLRIRPSFLSLAVGLSLPLSVQAVPVEFAPIVASVSGPPYPTAAVTVDSLVPTPGAPPLMVDRISVRLVDPIPAGALDWLVADSFGFGVEREMKESGEKGGTADINIGIGELFESSFGFSTPFAFDNVAVSGTQLSFDTVSPLGRVAYSSLFTTPQPAAFESLSVEPAADGRSFDLRLRLLFSDDYVPELALVAERSTADWVPIPEPAPWLLGLLGIGLARWRRGHGAP